MNAKRWCMAALAAALAVLLFICGINFYADPFGVFGDRFFDWYSYNMTNNPRSAKTAYIDKNAGEYDSFVVGCSSTSSFPAEDLEKAFGGRFYNMIMYGSDMADCEKTVKWLLENHKVKNIVLNVYPGNAVFYDFEGDKLTEGLHYKVSGQSAVSFYARHLFANPKYAFAKLGALKDDEYLSLPFDVFNVQNGAYDKRKRDAESIGSLEDYYAAYPVFQSYPKSAYTMPHIQDNANSIVRIKQMCHGAGARLVVVTAPVYYDYFKYFSREDIFAYYKSIVEACGGFWDFAVSSISLDPRFFYDETHFRNAAGVMAVAKMAGNPDGIYIPSDFGTFVTEENLEEHVGKMFSLTFDDASYTKKLPVLLYHHIDGEVSTPSIVSPETFDAQMAAISEAGYESVTLQQIYDYIFKGKDLPEKCFLLTFDDGYYSNLEKAQPILEKYGFKGVVFTVGAMAGKSVYKDTDTPCFAHLSAEDNKALLQRGTLDIQSHSFDMHQNAALEKQLPAYTDMLKLADESDISYVNRLNKDCKLMEKLLGYKPQALAFPHGKAETLTQAVLSENGIHFTFTTEYKTPTLIKGLAQSGYMMGRYTVYEQTDPQTLLDFLSK